MARAGVADVVRWRVGAGNEARTRSVKHAPGVKGAGTVVLRVLAELDAADDTPLRQVAAQEAGTSRTIRRVPWAVRRTARAAQTRECRPQLV